mmetsp:Transcript_19066/g.19334  ORF Transcript_19066/g.19334 Transcript_19066/m.19334 type:complete len:107 (-) Transcript_19066:190-510(-)
MNGRLNIGKCQKTVFPGWAFLFFCFPLLSYSNLFLSGASFCGVNAFYLFRRSKIVPKRKTRNNFVAKTTKFYFFHVRIFNKLMEEFFVCFKCFVSFHGTYVVGEMR